MGVLRPSRRLRRVSVCTGLLCGREIIWIYASKRVVPFEVFAPFEALAPSKCVHCIIMWAGDYVSLCMWACCSLRGACAEWVWALDSYVVGRICESLHLGVRSKCAHWIIKWAGEFISRDYVSLCIWESMLSYVFLCMHLIIWVAPFEILELKEGGAAKGMLRNAQLKEGGATRRHGKAIILLLYILVTFINY